MNSIEYMNLICESEFKYACLNYWFDYILSTFSSLSLSPSSKSHSHASPPSMCLAKCLKEFGVDYGCHIWQYRRPVSYIENPSFIPLFGRKPLHQRNPHHHISTESQPTLPPLWLDSESDLLTKDYIPDQKFLVSTYSETGVSHITGAPSFARQNWSTSRFSIRPAVIRMEKRESKPVTAAKATSGDSSSLVKIVDGNSSQQKKENTTVNTDEATSDDSLSPVVIVDGNSPQHMPKRKRECKPVTVAEATSGDFLLEEATPKVRGMPPSSRAKNRREYFRVMTGPNAEAGRMISRDYVPGHSVVIVRPTASVVETNTTEDDEEIFEEEAVCKFCFQVVEENVSKTNCSCKTALVHDECAANKIRVKGNNKCEVCDQDVPHLPVTLIRGQGPIAARDNVQESKKKSFFSLVKRAFQS